MDIGAPESAPERPVDHRDDGTAAASTFAGILAGAMTPAERSAPKPKPKESDASGGNAAGSATGATANAGAANDATSRVQRDLSRLAPQFRGPLERLIQRMQSEFGRQVSVVETTRDQARQDALFAQGRTTPGPVVTWTKSSLHLTGLAADVVIDGTYGDPKAYEQLAQVAREEGLRTLGPMDPGHVEFAATGGARAHVVAANIAGAGTAPGASAQIATVAAVAQVAQVAQVAEVAQVARVATVAAPALPGGIQGEGSGVADGTSGDSSARGAGALDANGSAPSARGTAWATHATAPATQPPAAMNAAAEAGATDPDKSGHKSEGAEPGRHESASGNGSHRTDVTSALLSGAPSTASTNALRHVGALGGADVAERIARVLQLQSDGASRPLSHVVLRLDDGDGNPDLIRVGVRGSGVDATLALRDPAVAGRLEAQIGELHQALGRHGLTGESLQVQLLASEALDAVRLGGRLVAPSASGGATLGQRQEHQPPSGHTPPRDQRGGNNSQSQQRPRHPFTRDS
jgi:hypothetical protein